MRILLIGGTGFIGSHVARQLVAAGHEVTALHRGRTRAAVPGVRVLATAGAPTPLTCFPDAAFDPEPDVVVHLIAWGEADARASVQAFAGRAGRIVGLSSMDVYRAYGRFLRLEPGPLEPVPLDEHASALRARLYPYRGQAETPDALGYWYEKILVERELMAEPILPGTVLRLPKVYGPRGDGDLASVYGFAHQPQWRWTHGYVEDVAAAIALATLDARAAGRIYNVGEGVTPTVEERLSVLPPSAIAPDTDAPYDFAQDLVGDTRRIRVELGYREIVPYEEGLRRTLAGCSD
jgi:nucleoside-diphosphate-sugar epimerase